MLEQARALTVNEMRVSALQSDLKVGRPLVPHEHGAWVILYAPLTLGIAAASTAPHASLDAMPVALLVVAVTAAFLARNAAGVLVRQRSRGAEEAQFWLLVYATAFAAAAGPLVLVYGRVQLMEIGAMVGALFAVHAALTALPARKRLDRSKWGELLAVGALCMTAPAAYVVAVGRLDSSAWQIWAVCAAFFGSGVLHVKMLLGSAKLLREPGGERSWVARLRAGRESLAYHALLLPATLAVAAFGGRPGALVAIGCAPVLVRAFVGAARLDGKLPPLKRVGAVETGYALWFTALTAAAVSVTRLV